MLLLLWVWLNSRASSKLINGFIDIFIVWVLSCGWAIGMCPIWWNNTFSLTVVISGRYTTICISCYCTLLFLSHGLIYHTNARIATSNTHQSGYNVPCIGFWAIDLWIGHQRKKISIELNYLRIKI